MPYIWYHLPNITIYELVINIIYYFWKNLFPIYSHGELTTTNVDGDECIRDGTVFPDIYKHFDLADAKISCKLEQKNKKFEITVKSDYPAFFVSFDTEGLKGKFGGFYFIKISIYRFFFFFFIFILNIIIIRTIW